MALELRHSLENLGIDGPTIKVGYCAFEKWRQSCTCGFDIPVMTCIIRIRPRYTNKSNHIRNRILLGMCVKQLPHLRPAKRQHQTTYRRKSVSLPRNTINEQVVWRGLEFAHGRHQPIRTGSKVFYCGPYEILIGQLSVLGAWSCRNTGANTYAHDFGQQPGRRQPNWERRGRKKLVHCARAPRSDRLLVCRIHEA